MPGLLCFGSTHISSRRDNVNPEDPLIYIDNMAAMVSCAEIHCKRVGLSNTAPQLPIGPNCQASPETTIFSPPNGRSEVVPSFLRNDHVLLVRMCLHVKLLISVKISIAAVENSSMNI